MDAKFTIKIEKSKRNTKKEIGNIANLFTGVKYGIRTHDLRNHNPTL